MSAERWAEGGCPCHPDPAMTGRTPDICLSTLSKLWLPAKQYLTNAYLRDARGGFHNRTQTALPRSHFCNWFGLWFINQLSLNVTLSHTIVARGSRCEAFGIRNPVQLPQVLRCLCAYIKKCSLLLIFLFFFFSLSKSFLPTIPAAREAKA